MSLFDRIFGRGQRSATARTVELRGDLSRATALYVAAGEPDEAARVLLLRADSETDPRAKLQFFAQATQLATAGGEREKSARKRHAELMLALAGDARVNSVARHDVMDAARELEAVGSSREAADAFARAGDKEGEARALQAAGDIERLEFLLSSEQFAQQTARSRQARTKEIEDMIACGRRREALAGLNALIDATPSNAQAERDWAASVHARRVIAPLVGLDIFGERWLIVLGDEVIIGRSEGAIRVNSNAVSRQHLRITRGECDDIFVSDLQSRNGTQLRGANVGGVLPIKDGIELTLGHEVALRITPSERLRGAIAIDIKGQQYVACVGPTRLPFEGLTLAAGDGGWIELVASQTHAYAGEIEWSSPATLLAGDALSTSRSGEPVIRIVST